MDFRTFDLIANVSSFSVLLPLLFFVLAIRKKDAPYPIKVSGALLFISGMSDLVSTILIEFRINPNLVITVYVILQFVLLSLIYRNAFTPKFYKKITVVGIAMFLIFAAYNLFVIQGVTGFNSNAFTISSAIFIAYSVAFFYRLFVELPAPQVQQLFMFWFNSAIFIYFGFNLFIFISVDRLIESENDQILYSWAFHNCINVVRNLMFTTGLYIAAIMRR